MLLIPAPRDPKWLKNMEEADSRLEWLYTHARPDLARHIHRRGTHVSLPAGCGFGGGRLCPGNYANSTYNQRLIDEVLMDPAIQRLARFVDGMPSLMLLLLAS